jgi:hypothetical protein
VNLHNKTTHEMEELALKRLTEILARNSEIPWFKISASMMDDYRQLAKEILAKKKLEMGIREPIVGWRQ